MFCFVLNTNDVRRARGVAFPRDIGRCRLKWPFCCRWWEPGLWPQTLQTETGFEWYDGQVEAMFVCRVGGIVALLDRQTCPVFASVFVVATLKRDLALKVHCIRRCFGGGYALARLNPSMYHVIQTVKAIDVPTAWIAMRWRSAPVPPPFLRRRFCRLLGFRL